MRALLLLLAPALGCSSSSRNTTKCEIGTTAPCRDTDGCAGVRLCQPNGELGPCVCSADAGTGGNLGSGGSGGSAGSAGSSGSAGSGGVDSSAGSGGSAGAGGSGGSGGSISCPSGRGARMVVAGSPAGSFCIDATETTNAEYAQFLANPDVAPQPAVCAWNQSFQPRFAGGPTLPVVGVDFCDARAYCEWAGKRLCGRIGGGATPFNSHADARESQWYAACSASGTRVFPYGNTYDPTACNGADLGADVDALVPVASTRCEGGPAGVFDMSGNAWEWENSCNGEIGVDDKCRLRSGEFTNPSGFLRCDYGEFYIERDFTSNSIGIRCCGP